MKSAFFLIACFFCISSANSQITLTALTHTPDTNQRHIYRSSTISGNRQAVDLSGANQIWDFSNTITDSMVSMNILSESNSTSPNVYGGVNFVRVFSDGSESYIRSSSNGQKIVGNVFPVAEGQISYTTPRDYLFFPMSYGDSTISSFHGDGSHNSGATVSRDGNVKIVALGYGQLYLPADTFTDVLKVGIIAQYSDSISTGTTYDFMDTTYLWFSETSSIPIVESFSIAVGGILVDLLYLLDSSYSLLDVNYSLTQSPYKLYPNPAQEYLTFENPTQDKMTINIFNAVGALEMIISDVRGDRKIDVSNFAPGMYVFYCNNGKQSYVEKLNIQ